MINQNEIQQYILRAIRNATSDDLERANAAFRGLSPEVMAQEYGQSGKSRQAILDAYKRERELNIRARAYIAAAPEMYEALKAAEWGGNRGEKVCPVCRRLGFEGHKQDCILTNALAKVNGKEDANG